MSIGTELKILGLKITTVIMFPWNPGAMAGNQCQQDTSILSMVTSAGRRKLQVHEVLLLCLHMYLT